jgi:membrane protease YdiL (CAAX protease family)
MALWRVLVVIPWGPSFSEELAFRGLLLALLGRRYGVLAGILLSSGLFGLCMLCRHWAGRPTPR